MSNTGLWRRIAAMMPRLEAGRPGRFARTQLYPVAAEVAELRRESFAEATRPARPARDRQNAPAR